uniref:Uncharacterized protein n=1 Tax=Pseudo-nitzschia australis TaxID=44445 RepID=A0A7S4A8Y0_9STRA|mmetsp:Transcript_17147/g.37508  ORF Transcript_17147/g.37508 Transcript_17147/m.37508 type:complete len:204 (-) Transcript_17147:105-716(-)|eukprot:CAMPEP_0168193726 /NCGR_PEP_ID=MMETSP0139_2-20121125/18768_1 /TAXON_ID=44445 /ORGANISM="Pseudo-nitzschia australis, Strain 10249 10 AB" /LENGTH=203 /DNA_ID=CAMNT_0008117117 /DNA_START=46 /DNA_END=657 /DNA_ORIENTATION=+
MAPLTKEFCLSLTSFDDEIDQPKTIIAPLSECRIAAPRQVSFGADVYVYEVLNRGDYTPEEIEESWFNRNDMRRMKQGTRAEAKLVESGLLVQGKEVSIRGLESRTRDGIRRKRRNRMNAYGAVFFEIDCQDEERFVDEKLIADAYFVYSENCAMEAQMIGKRDEHDAMQIFQNKTNDFFGKKFCQSIVDLSTTNGSLASSAA